MAQDPTRSSLNSFDEDVAEREQDFRLIADSIPALVNTMKPNGEIEWCNRQVRAYFNLPFDDLAGWQASAAVHPEDLPMTIVNWQRGIASGSAFEYEHRLRRFDGVYRWFHFRALPVRDKDGRLVRWYNTLADIDDQKRAEEGLRRLQARFTRAAHLATVSELAASIAHEINQPIASVSASAHACLRWLAADPPNIERARLSAERIARDGSSAADVVSRIRSLFRHAPPVKEVLNVNEVIQEVCALMAEDLRSRSVVLFTDLQADLQPTAADRVQLQQLLANLVRNAAEAMDGVHERARELSISSRQNGDEITVQVTDWGVGLSAPEAVFDPFYTTKPNGMGMGLAICRTITEAHDGRLWATPNSQYGATFAFALRATIPSSAQS